MNPALFRSILAFLLATGTAAQAAPPQAEFPLYGLDSSCVCIRTGKATETIGAVEVTSGKSVFQQFYLLKDPAHRELFRVEIGQYVGNQLVKWWKYGIADEADFNGDGIPDYSWYGGDDTSHSMLLFLSSKNGYRRVDIIKTLEKAWEERFHRDPPDLADSDIEISNLRLKRSGSGLTLITQIEIGTVTGKKADPVTLSVDESRFKP